MRNVALEILDAARTRPGGVAMRHQRQETWQDITYGEMAARIDRLAAGLVALGVAPGDRVAIFAPNQPEWILADYAAMSVQAVTVPIYATSTAEQAGLILQDSGAKVLFTGAAAQRDAALAIAGACPELRWIVTMDPDVAPAHPAGGAGLRAQAELESLPPDPARTTEIERRRRRAASGDLAAIMYTSGTTGEPKGVMLRHANFVNQYSTVDSRFDVGPDDRSLCFLPLSHAYERTWSGYVFLKGALNVILANPRQVVTALAETRPTVMVSAPRLYEKVHAAVHARVDAAPPLRRRLFRWAVATGHRYWSGHYAGARADLRLRLAFAVVQ